MGKIILNDIEYAIGVSNGSNIDTTNLVEKDSIVTTLDDTVTDEQIPSAKAVYDKLSDLPTDSGSKCYTSLNELGLTADATIEDVVNALNNGESFLAPVNTFTNYETIFPNKVPSDQWNKIHIIKGTSLPNSHIRCYSQSGACEYLANVNNTNITGWNDVSGTYIDISDAIIEKLGNEILKYPVGKYRINSTTTGNKFTDLPSDAEMKCGLIEINGTAVGKSPFTDAWVYRMYKFECLTGTLSYVRRLNSGATVGQIEVDSGWQIEIPLGQQVYSNTPIGTVLSFAGQTPPNGYLLCDGSSYAVADYQDLYDVIGNTYGGDSTNFNVPDYRETVLVGVGENTTDTIATHDVYELGEFKDDQLQGHEHNTYKNYEGSATGGAGSTTTYGGVVSTLDIISDDTNGTPRVGTTTYGKQKGVTYIIKAFYTNEGVDAPVELEDNVINHIDNKVLEVISNYLFVGKQYPTTETCPIGCWYGVYFD